MTVKSIRPKQPPRLADGNTVSVIMARTIKTGCELAFWTIETEVEVELNNVTGFLAINHLPIMSNGNNEYITIVQFDSVEHLILWEQSAIRAVLLTKINELIDGDIRRKSVTGLEGMFDAPLVDTSIQLKVPPKYKMAILIIGVIFIMLQILSPMITSFAAFLPEWIRSFIVVVIQVLLMTYFVMPALTRWLSNWLFKK